MQSRPVIPSEVEESRSSGQRVSLPGRTRFLDSLPLARNDIYPAVSQYRSAQS